MSYDKSSEILEIELQDKKIYRYKDVPDNLYCHLLLAYSKDDFFNEVIKDEYACSRVK